MKQLLCVVLLLCGGVAAATEPASPKGREAHAADIAYWTSGYDGQDLVSGKFACKAPELPVISKTNAEINSTNKAIADWQACYNGFVANVNANMPPLKRVPAEVAAVMTPDEIEQARQHLEGVYNKVVGEAQAGATAALERQEAWRTATEKFVAEQNSANRKQNEAANQQMIDEQRRALERAPRPITGVR